jgi:PAS domain S-box-containing protein
MALTALDGTVVAVNGAACELYGRSAEELVGSPGIDVVHPDDRAASAVNMERLACGRVGSIRQERRFLRPDGTTVWADSSTQAVTGPDGHPLYWQSILVDITDRKHSDEGLAYLAAIVQSSPDAILSSTLEAVITSWNPGAEALYGYSADEIIGRDGRLLLVPEQVGDRGRICQQEDP